MLGSILPHPTPPHALSPTHSSQIVDIQPHHAPPLFIGMWAGLTLLDEGTGGGIQGGPRNWEARKMCCETRYDFRCVSFSLFLPPPDHHLPVTSPPPSTFPCQFTTTAASTKPTPHAPLACTEFHDDASSRRRRSQPNDIVGSQRQAWLVPRQCGQSCAGVWMS